MLSTAAFLSLDLDQQLITIFPYSFRKANN